MTQASHDSGHAYITAIKIEDGRYRLAVRRVPRAQSICAGFAGSPERSRFARGSPGPPSAVNFMSRFRMYYTVEKFPGRQEGKDPEG